MISFSVRKGVPFVKVSFLGCYYKGLILTALSFFIFYFYFGFYCFLDLGLNLISFIICMFICFFRIRNFMKYYFPFVFNAIGLLEGVVTWFDQALHFLRGVWN